MSRRDGLILRAFALWTAYVWGTRIWNIWRDRSRDLPFKAVHTVLAVVSVAFAVAAWRVVQRNRTDRRASRTADADARAVAGTRTDD